MRKNKLLSIVKHYGILHQIKYLYTEIFELTEAVISGDKKHITEEYADCMVLLAQVCEYFKLDHISIDVIMDNKIDRQLKRIENEIANNSEIEYAIVTDTEENARVKAENFIRYLKHIGKDFKVNYKRPIEVIINFQHIYFMGDVSYKRWCKGRTYIIDGVVYHSGYPI